MRAGTRANLGRYENSAAEGKRRCVSSTLHRLTWYIVEFGLLARHAANQTPQIESYEASYPIVKEASLPKIPYTQNLCVKHVLRGRHKI